MNYEQRMSLIKAWFKSDIVPRFNMPRDLDPKTVASDIIEAINRNIDKTNEAHFKYILEEITKHVVKNAKTRALPTVREFLDGIRNSPESHGERREHASKSSDYSYHLTAKRIRSGEPISDIFLRNSMRKKLKKITGITDKELEPYEKYLAQAAHMQ